MKIISLVLLSVFVLSGCIDINLKSELPSVKYYEIDNIESITSKSCGAYNYIALPNITLPSEYRNNKILLRRGNEVVQIDDISLLRGINESLESMIIKDFNSKCIKTILPPFSGMSLDSTLRLKLLTFMIEEKDSATNAVISVFYQINQKGTILQSGTITSRLLIDNDKNAYIEGLQYVSKDMIEELANLIIPK